MTGLFCAAMVPACTELLLFSLKTRMKVYIKLLVLWFEQLFCNIKTKHFNCMYSLLSGQIPNNADKCLCHDSLNNPRDLLFVSAETVAAVKFEYQHEEQ